MGLLSGLLACLFVCLFVSLFAGPTQWLQPLHRTKQTTGDIANSRDQYLCFLDACSLVCLLACLFVSLFLCFFVFVLFAHLFVHLGPTQWLQPLHRTKKKTGDIANGRYQDLYFFGCLLVNLLVCLFACFYVCLFR